MELFGLVLAGGASKRMGRDKGALTLHGTSLVARIYRCVQSVTTRAYVGCRQDQGTQRHLQGYPQLHDRREDAGPMASIERAFEERPDVGWLVVACDMPYLDVDGLKHLVVHRNPHRVATCYWNHEMQWPEPLCTIYEPRAADVISEALDEGRSCPRRLLKNCPIEPIRPTNMRLLCNTNTPEAFRAAQRELEWGEVGLARHREGAA